MVSFPTSSSGLALNFLILSGRLATFAFAERTTVVDFGFNLRLNQRFSMSELATINQSVKLPYRYERGQPYKRTFDMPTCLVPSGLVPVLICLTMSGCISFDNDYGEI